MTAPSPQERVAFYSAALLGLRALDARDGSARRLGTDAEARWLQFAGALGPGDRLDILLRDASITWGAAFSPSAIFDFFGLADDEPFGPDWPGIADGTARRLLMEQSDSLGSEDAAKILGVPLSPPVPVPPLVAASKLVVAGGSAIAAVARAFASRNDLSWSDQVLVVADKASFRQFASLVAVTQGARSRTSLVRSGMNVPRDSRFPHLDFAVVSDDAEPACAELARSLAGH